MQNINETQFEQEVLRASIPTLVDFWAEWCGPCRMLTPILEEISPLYANKVKIVKVNVDESPTVAAKYGIRGIPTLLLFKEGKVEATKFGALSKSELTAFLDDNI